MAVGTRSVCSREPCVRERGRRDCEDRGVDTPVCRFAMSRKVAGRFLERAGWLHRNVLAVRHLVLEFDEGFRSSLHLLNGKEYSNA